ncbi:MAG: hypothetical protein VW576_02210 [Opitutae bacterium]
MKKFLLSLTPLIVTFGYWIADGARVSPWATRVESREEIPVVDGMPELGTQTKVTWTDEFVCGIETPLAGLCLTLVILTVQLCQKRGLKNLSP